MKGKAARQDSVVQRQSPGKVPTLRQGRVSTDDASPAHPKIGEEQLHL